eukprot:TRINITY_DN9889_c2_g1_i1.p1 TRINITY_DN9889_c2_g1~~TRINITY_DN9889_c2_g1_i1.p1  ORF type:complete len:136 (-),score=10.39 TRINITY_DN9889_c2_g1_i1:360-767(-)
MLRKHKQDLSPAIPKKTSYLLAIPTNPGLPLAAPSTLNLNTLGEGGDQRTTPHFTWSASHARFPIKKDNIKTKIGELFSNQGPLSDPQSYSINQHRKGRKVTLKNHVIPFPPYGPKNSKGKHPPECTAATHQPIK